jgi:hypothetical protein
VPPPRLDWTDDVQRRSAVSALCRVGGGDGDAAARVAVAWLGSGASPGVLSVCVVKHSGRTGAARVRERATLVLHASVWDVSAAAGAGAGAPAAVIGTSAGASLVDLNAMRSSLILAPGSDVLSVAAEPDAAAWALCGARNGRVCVADCRAPPASNASAAASSGFRVGAAVTSLSLLPGEPRCALACGVDGGLARWDLRAVGPGAAPVARYDGHNNSATLALRHTVDAQGALVAAPGEDGVVRVWSLPAAGAPLLAGCAVAPPAAAAAAAARAPPASARVTFTAAAFDARPGACAPAAAPPRLWLGAHEGLALAWPARGTRLPPVMHRWPAR